MSTYNPTDYINDNEPAINEINLNHSESGIETAHEEIEEIALGNTSVLLAETCDQSRFVRPASDTVLGGVKVYVITDVATGEITGFMDSATLGDLPNAVIDFNASDRLPGIIRVDFQETPKTLWYDLYRDGALIATNITPGFEYLTEGGTWNFHVTSNNVFGSVVGVSDEGTARNIATEPPAPIIDFTASADRVQNILFNWTDNLDSYRFDIMSGTAVIAQDVWPGDSVIIPEGAADYYVRAVNNLGSTDSNIDEGVSLGLIPSAITDFSATDAVTGDTSARITINFSYVLQPATYDLYRSDTGLDTFILLRSGVHDGYELSTPAGTWDFKVAATNSLDTVFSNEDSGTAISSQYPPEAVHDFEAFDGRRSVSINFTPSLDAESFDLYRDSLLFEANVYPGFETLCEEGTFTYFVQAKNPRGSADSNTDDATSLAAFTSAPDVVTDLYVTTDLVTSVAITFTEVADTTRFDLYRDGEPYKVDVYTGMVIPSFPGTWLFEILAVNPIGTTKGVPGSTGTALASTGLPSFPVEDFLASDTEIELIEMTWSAGNEVARYDLYKNQIRIRSDISRPYSLPSEVGTWEFKVKGLNLHGAVYTRPDEGSAQDSTVPPSVITDFMASDNLTEEIQFTFSLAAQASYYSLYKDDILISNSITSGDILSFVPGTYSFYVVAHNSLGSVPCDPHDQGTAVVRLDEPAYISDFSASDDQFNQVTVTFSLSANATSYNLYKGDVLFAEDIVSGQAFEVIGPNTSSYYVDAINKDENTISNSDTGTAVSFLPGEVTIDYNSYTWEGVGEDTVTITNGVGVFTPPVGVVSVNVCIAGGGGSGGNGFSSGSAAGGSGGGGGAGSVSGILTVVPFEATPLTVGAGGIANLVNGGNGYEGETSSILAISASGGKGGTAWPSDPSGNGVGGPGGSGGGAGGNGSQAFGPSQPGIAFSGCGGSHAGGPGVGSHSCADCGIGGGGGAGGFGDGGSGSAGAAPGTVPGISGGSGGSGEYLGGPLAGGNGRVKITWG